MEKMLKAIQDDYPDDIAWCYGCGRLNKSGHHFRTSWQGEKTVTIYTPQPEHMAIPGFVYGGGACVVNRLSWDRFGIHVLTP